MVLIGTVYDFYKRLRHFILCQDIESSSEKLLPDSSNSEIISANQETIQKIDEIDDRQKLEEQVEDLYFKYLKGKFWFQKT